MLNEIIPNDAELAILYPDYDDLLIRRIAYRFDFEKEKYKLLKEKEKEQRNKEILKDQEIKLLKQEYYNKLSDEYKNLELKEIEQRDISYFRDVKKKEILSQITDMLTNAFNKNDDNFLTELNLFLNKFPELFDKKLVKGTPIITGDKPFLKEPLYV
jgi:hypothetical protein